MRVLWWQTMVRSEGEMYESPSRGRKYGPARIFLMGLRLSISVGTRKIANYGWSGWSQRKLWWKSEGVL